MFFLFLIKTSPAISSANITFSGETDVSTFDFDTDGIIDLIWIDYECSSNVESYIDGIAYPLELFYNQTDEMGMATMEATGLSLFPSSGTFNYSKFIGGGYFLSHSLRNGFDHVNYTNRLDLVPTTLNGTLGVEAEGPTSEKLTYPLSSLSSNFSENGFVQPCENEMLKHINQRPTGVTYQWNRTVYGSDPFKVGLNGVNIGLGQVAGGNGTISVDVDSVLGPFLMGRGQNTTGEWLTTSSTPIGIPFSDMILPENVDPLLVVRLGEARGLYWKSYAVKNNGTIFTEELYYNSDITIYNLTLEAPFPNNENYTLGIKQYYAYLLQEGLLWKFRYLCTLDDYVLYQDIIDLETPSVTPLINEFTTVAPIEETIEEPPVPEFSHKLIVLVAITIFFYGLLRKNIHLFRRQ